MPSSRICAQRQHQCREVQRRIVSGHQPIKMTGATMRLLELTNTELQRFVRALAVDSAKVFITEHARDRMLERGVTDLEVIKCLRRGVIQRPPQLDRKTGHLKCRMEHFGPSRNLAVVAALDDTHPDVVVVTVMTRTR